MHRHCTRFVQWQVCQNFTSSSRFLSCKTGSVVFSTRSVLDCTPIKPTLQQLFLERERQPATFAIRSRSTTCKTPSLGLFQRTAFPFPQLFPSLPSSDRYWTDCPGSFTSGLHQCFLQSRPLSVWCLGFFKTGRHPVTNCVFLRVSLVVICSSRGPTTTLDTKCGDLDIDLSSWGRRINFDIKPCR